MYKKLSLLSLTLLLSSLHFQTSQAQTRGFHFLRTTIGARPSALAGAFTAIKGDIHSVTANPAALSSINGKAATFDYVNSALDIQSGFGAYVQDFGGGKVALAFQYQDYGSFETTDALGTELGSFSANSLVLTAAYSQKYTDELSVGGAVKFIHSGIDVYSTSGFAADLALFYDAPIFGGLQVGGGVFNLGKATSAFIETKESMPTRFEIGVSKRLAHLPLQYSLTAQKYLDDDFYFAAGGEFRLSEQLKWRIGYNSIGSDLKIGGEGRFAGVSTGFGVKIQDKYGFDYAYSSMGTVGAQILISFSLQL